MTAARLRWTEGERLPAAARDKLLGPGAPFEMGREAVLGRAPVDVFLRRPPNVPALLARAVAAHADRPYLAFADEELTYAQVDDEAARIAAVLVDHHGVQPGDRVALLAANTAEHVLAFWAVLKAGAIVVGLNGWWTATEVAEGIAITSPTVVLVDEQRRERLTAIDVPFEDLLALRARARAAEPLPVRQPHEDEPAMIMFTSGTSGRAKAATLTHRALVHFGQASMLRGAVMAAAGAVAPSSPQQATAAQPRPQSSALAANPLFHVSGSVVLLIATWTGGRVVFVPPGRWDATTHLERTVRYGITSWSGVPTQLGQLIDHPHLADFDLSSLRTVSSGGAALPPVLLQRFRERLPGASVGTGYGASETAGIGTGIGGAEYLAHPTSVGGANPTAEIEIRRLDSSVADEDETGEIFVRSACVLLGYWGDDVAKAAAIDADGWYATGDFGWVSDGRLYLEGRRRDRIIRGGENVSPLEIEHRIREHADVEDVAVIGVPDDVLGQKVVAVVVARSGASLDPDELRAWVAEVLAPFKVPAEVAFVDALPMTATGKVRKTELEQQWLSGPSAVIAPPPTA